MITCGHRSGSRARAQLQKLARTQCRGRGLEAQTRSACGHKEVEAARGGVLVDFYLILFDCRIEFGSEALYFLIAEF